MVKRRSLYFIGPRQVEVREERLPLPAPGEVLVRSIVSAISAGTEMLFYRHQLDDGISLDATLSSLSGSARYPFKYGYATVGQVVDRGAGVPRELEGRLVFAFHPHESYFSSPADQLIPVPTDLGAEDAVMLPSMETAVSLVMDGAPLVGEDVLMVGQGAIGLLTTAVLALMPLGSLTAVEKHPLRKRLSKEMGCHACLDIAPYGELVKACPFGARGADLTFELSGNPDALDTAMRLTGFEGRVVVGSWYGNKAAQAHFGEVFHRRRLRIIGSQVSNIAPSLTGRWDKGRRLRLSWNMVRQIRPSRLVTHRFNVEDAGEAYELIDRGDDGLVQALLSYGGE